MIYSKEQLRIINSKAKTIMVNSVAGSGKTTTINAVIRKAISSGIKPKDMLVCTFTRKMASELKASNPRLEWCDTIHGAALKIVDAHRKDVGYVRRMILISDLEDREIIRTTIERNGFKSTLSGAMEAVADYCSHGEIDRVGHKHRIFVQTYLRELRSRDFVTYGLIEYYASIVIERHPEIKFDLVIVDEYQDTSDLESKILRMLCRDRMIVVGDVMQSIYGFRGANIGNMTSMTADEVHNMSQSYRLPSKVATLANKLIAMNSFGYDMKIIPNSSEGVLREVEENDIIALDGELKDALKIYSPEDIYILTRTNSQIKYIVESLYDAPIDKELSAAKNMLYLSYLDIACTAYYNGYYNYGLTRLLRLFDYRDRDIVAYEIAGGEIYSKVKNDLPVKQFDNIMKRDAPFIEKAETMLPMFEKRRGEYDTMMVRVLPYIEHIKTDAEFMEWYRNVSEADFMPKDKVAVLTVHQAKGMENKAILLPFISDGVFPNHRACFQEELRLFYVAATRAKEYLSIMHDRSVFMR